MDADLQRAPRVCFFAHYDRFNQVADHVVLYLEALRAAGFTTVVLSTATLPDGEQARLRRHCHTLVMRENVGLDFGGWGEAIARFFPLTAEFLLLTNDSIYAPLGDLAAFIDALTAVPADVYGAVESQEHAPHLQSWFVLLRPAAYAADAFVRFMTGPVSAGLTKDEIVVQREVGLTRLLRDSGLSYRAAYADAHRGPIARRRPINPTHILWRQLIEDEGFPFVKVDLDGVGEWPALVGPRNPQLAAAIGRDLRRFAPPPATGWRDRLAWSVDYYPAYWPESYGFMVRDHRFACRPLAAWANAGGYFALETIGKIVRKTVRAVRGRRGAAAAADGSRLSDTRGAG